VVVVDKSLSQSVGERAARAEESLAALTAALDRQPRLETRIVTSDGSLTQGDGAVGGGSLGSSTSGTRVFEDLTQAFADVPAERRAGAFLITDGQIHDVPDLATLENTPYPIHSLLTGNPDQTDRVLLVSEPPGFGLVGRSVPVTVTLEDPAVEDGTPLSVTLTRDGGTPVPLTVPANRPTELALELDHAGQNVYELRAESRDGEVSLLNNHAAVSVNGVRDRLRVLLVSGQPHSGERTWRNLLKADPAVDLVHFTILRPPRKEDLTPLSELALIAFPIQELFEEKLDEFDLIIFDRYSRRGLVPVSYLGNIAYYVEQGGALLLSVGPEITEPFSLADSPIADVLPAMPNGSVLRGAFRPELSDAGGRHPVTANLPGAPPIPGEAENDAASGGALWGRWLRQVATDPISGTTLMTGASDLPVLTLDRIGEGRVALLTSDTIWLWAKGYEGGGPQGELLRRLAHWLMKEPELEEESLAARIEGDRLTVTARSLEDTPAEITITAPDGSEQTLSLTEIGPGRASASLRAGLPGAYQITDGDREAFAVAGAPNPLETTRMTATTALLEPVAQATGGAIFTPSDGTPLIRRIQAGQSTRGQGWMGVLENSRHTVAGVSLSPMLPLPVALLLIVGGLGLAWYREGR
ncbi:MAG: hypothetical protein ACPGYL_08410, partial [Rhodospirillaceae bacterium]